VPVDDDYYVMRRQIWLATDVAYKRALQALSKKKATAQSRAAEPDPIPDFSRETPAETLLPAAAAGPPARAWSEDARKISAVFLGYPDIDSSEVSLSDSQGTRYYVNSEGFKVVEPIGLATLRVVADTQAPDGMALRDFFTASARSVKDLPPVADIVARTKELAGGLVALRSVPVGEDFTGPVLVEGQASPVLLSQTLVPLVLSSRAPEIDGMPAGAASRFPVSPFLTRIGSRVLPEGFSISDTPSVERFGDVVLPASYRVDDEGVRAKDVTLVQHGKLLTLLTSRTPQKGLLQSNAIAAAVERRPACSRWKARARCRPGS
jgi:predicted Zn-dependent protease